MGSFLGEEGAQRRAHQAFPHPVQKGPLRLGKLFQGAAQGLFQKLQGKGGVGLGAKGGEGLEEGA